MSRATIIIPIPESTDSEDLIPLINERLLRVAQEIGSGTGSSSTSTTIVNSSSSFFQLEYL